MAKQSFFTAIAASLLLSGASAHMIMKSPFPYHNDTVSTSPLSGSGTLQFPCQMGVSGVYSSPNPTVAQAGSTVPLAFTGSAVHGGGSCQVSLFKLGTANTVTANPNDWKVIHSILGGCPGTAQGNLNAAAPDPFQRPDGPQCTDNTQTECKRVFNIPIDKNIPTGNYALAWTWFNKIGNREMYMNCAPFQVTGGATDDTFLQSLPGIFVANIPGQCTTVETQGVLGIPNPGSSVEVSNNPLDLVDPKVLGTCPSGTGAAPAAQSTIGSSGGASAAPPAAAAASNVPSGSASAPAQSNTAVSSTVTLTATMTSVVSTVTAPAVAVAPTVKSNSAAAAAPSSAPVAPSAACANPCSTDGAVICIGTASFGLCNHGCAVAQQLAAGTTCSNGLITRKRLARRGIDMMITEVL
jgi:hypothetical protein